MSRRRNVAVTRKPNGRAQRGVHPELLPPGEIKRLLDASAAGMRDASWGTALSRRYISGKITSSQFAAGKFWVELVMNYSAASLSPRLPKAVLGAPGGSPVDPDSAAGRREARRHARASADFLDGRHVLRLASREVERVVDDVRRLVSAS